jgi:ABC-2 type transport system ATP-binding protein
MVVVVLAAAAAAAVAVLARPGPVVRLEQVSIAGVPEPAPGAAAGGAVAGPGGPVRLDGTLYLPELPNGGRAAAVLLAHGLGGSKADLDDEAHALAEQGYVALAISARGFGASGGLVHLDAPDFEVADGRRWLDYLATRPEVLLDGAGDPRVGITGASYGGAFALLTAGYDRRVDAIAPLITWNDLRTAIFKQSLLPPVSSAPASDTTAVASGVFARSWAALFLGPGGSTSRPSLPTPSAAVTGGAVSTAGPVWNLDGVSCGRLAQVVCDAYRQMAATGQATPAILDLLAASSPVTVTSRIQAPTLLMQGEADSLFPIAQGEANAAQIAANRTPVKVVWQGGGHDGGLDESERLQAMTLTWFDRYLRRDGSPTDTRFEVTVPAAQLSADDSRPAPQIRDAASDPHLNQADPRRLLAGPERVLTIKALTGPSQTVVAPAGGAPAALTVVPGLGSLGAVAQAPAGTAATGRGAFDATALASQSAFFETAALTEPMQVAGLSLVELNVARRTGTGPVTLFVSLRDVAPDGGSRLPAGLVAPVRLADLPAGADGVTLTVQLPSVVLDIPSGHRLRVAVTTTDQAYALATSPSAYQISLPPPALRDSPDGGQLAVSAHAFQVLDAGGLSSLTPYAAGILLLLAGALVTVRFGRRRWRSPSDAATAHSARDSAGGGAVVPIVVTGLGKAYDDGYRAVSDLSFTVEPGWVLGLLGPNGAGKTTTLRMLMGLIRPSEGQIRVFGQPVGPGAPVLSRVGCFVEGPGFLPHVSGSANLQLFWATTGRPLEDAQLAEALEIAGLGEDVHRRVRTYSQGMRQRLAIAQAMLGLPELLVLDEPTNGLDPPQIREMREVLTRYAATGRTVVVSSHLLAEVEQTCSHVVVMHRGRLVAEGEVAQIVGAATRIVVDVDDPARAAAVARTVPAAADVDVTPTGIVLSLTGPRADLVRELVAAGLAVERVSPQRGLEEAFLTLVGES